MAAAEKAHRLLQVTDCCGGDSRGGKASTSRGKASHLSRCYKPASLRQSGDLQHPFIAQQDVESLRHCRGGCLTKGG